MEATYPSYYGKPSLLPRTVMSIPNSELSVKSKLLFGYLVAAADKTHSVQILQTDLAPILGFGSKRTLSRHLKELEDTGLITRTRSTDQHGRPSEYRIAEDWIPTAEDCLLAAERLGIRTGAVKESV